jgi:hypothetical protein
VIAGIGLYAWADSRKASAPMEALA